MKRQNGFTVLELIVAIVFLVLAGTIFFIQKRNIEVANRDAQRRTAINAMYYNLEDIYFPTNQSYPEHVTSDKLKGLDPTLLKDPDGKAVESEGSNYRYAAKDCVDGNCKSYTLTADLENEADYTKASRTH